jgi:hypothetical protein
VCESQVLILKELQRADTVAYFRTDVNNPLARFARERVVKACTALVNAIRGLGMEYGIVLPQGVAKFKQTFRAMFEAEQDNLLR